MRTFLESQNLDLHSLRYNSAIMKVKVKTSSRVMKEVDKPVFIDNVEIAGSYLFLASFLRSFFRF